ncbi:uncharacterized protein LOC101849086 isoform X1 [Aplysia californica]|uniref:Uncharacterized protein LOC101849086 isoform X1 n=1 Tax=Aplysia californica TaxID=6500 RepID=A0ABM1AB02_APLCA|nr:uncharacterized protein LOC101849086 isoform X1 [Aplysia californica]
MCTRYIPEITVCVFPGEDSGFKYYGTVGGVCAAVVAVMATAIGVYFVRQYRMRQQKQSQANAETIVPLGARSYINGSFSEPPSFALSVTSPASVTPQPGTKTGHL